MSQYDSIAQGTSTDKHDARERSDNDIPTHLESFLDDSTLKTDANSSNIISFQPEETNLAHRGSLSQRKITLQQLKRTPSGRSPSAVSLSQQQQQQQQQQQHHQGNESDPLLAPISVKTPKSWTNCGSLLLENKGSVARDHLASERTFLAWLRTSLSLASVGVGVAQLLKLGGDAKETVLLLRLSKGLGLCFILLATTTLLIGTFRYFLIQSMLTVNEFPASRFGVGLVLSTVFMLCVAVFVVILTL